MGPDIVPSPVLPWYVAFGVGLFFVAMLGVFFLIMRYMIANMEALMRASAIFMATIGTIILVISASYTIGTIFVNKAWGASVETPPVLLGITVVGFIIGMIIFFRKIA